MSSMEMDPHPLCLACRGSQCSRDNTCSECREWPASQWERFARKKNSKCESLLSGSSLKSKKSWANASSTSKSLPEANPRPGPSGARSSSSAGLVTPGSPPGPEREPCYKRSSPSGELSSPAEDLSVDFNQSLPRAESVERSSPEVRRVEGGTSIPHYLNPSGSRNLSYAEPWGSRNFSHANTSVFRDWETSVSHCADSSGSCNTGYIWSSVPRTLSHVDPPRSRDRETSVSRFVNPTGSRNTVHSEFLGSRDHSHSVYDREFSNSGCLDCSRSHNTSYHEPSGSSPPSDPSRSSEDSACAGPSGKGRRSSPRKRPLEEIRHAPQCSPLQFKMPQARPKGKRKRIRPSPPKWIGLYPMETSSVPHRSR
ncbi:uncharacterized protein [Palaemon carinicauda]|uniref:uncharacterized protein n=1 Tax=Palaemon carinicauda TaxID=392227 RepID=UPI0035B657BE